MLDPDDVMVGFPPPETRLVTTDHQWQDPPYGRWAFQHVRELVPTACVTRGDGPRSPLPLRPQDLGGITVPSPGDASLSVEAWLHATDTDAFLVIHKGAIVAEEYFHGMRPWTTHLLESVSKSVVATVAGVLAGRGVLDPDEQLTRYVPEFAQTSFDGATVRHLLDMRAGTRFNEDYDDPEADVRLLEALVGWRRLDEDLPARGLYEYILTLDSQGPHGGPFDYRSILTDVLGWVVERAAGRRLCDLLSEHLWVPLAAEYDAEITVDRYGSPLADGGLCCTARDLGRLGLAYARGGAFDGRQVVPAAWVADCVRGDDDARRAFAASPVAATFPGWFYRNKWWVMDSDRGVFTGLGIYGQMLFVHQAADVVGVKFSSWPVADSDERVLLHARGMVAIADALARG